ncbi:Hint domain-containing protein [Mangrovicoccus sp. HB161399]|uniref:Hint domain-containing protein n=1 Tax=Mangrovicoccus sp. HB161399 TaxID=2720392 RepID=UPI002110580F|nr:Hint domain-containing protein [Mangrovicoccus sp. HB161399]
MRRARAGTHGAPGGRLARDTRVQTPGGMRRMRDLRVGEMVETQDRGPQEILWIGRSRLSREDLEDAPERRPVRIRRGALAPGLPRRDLVVAPEHRLALSDPALVRSCRSATVLFPALALADGDAISLLPPNRGWTFLQLLLPHHALLLAEGCASESFSESEARDLGGEVPLRIDGLPVAQGGQPLPSPDLGEARALWRDLRERSAARGALPLQHQPRVAAHNVAAQG